MPTNEVALQNFIVDEHAHISLGRCSANAFLAAMPFPHRSLDRALARQRRILASQDDAHDIARTVVPLRHDVVKSMTAVVAQDLLAARYRNFLSANGHAHPVRAAPVAVDGVSVAAAGLQQQCSRGLADAPIQGLERAAITTAVRWTTRVSPVPKSSWLRSAPGLPPPSAYFG